MKKTRAIYVGDLRFDECPVFELNEETGYYEMNKDIECKYSKECVKEEGSDFLIFEAENDLAKFVKSNAQ